jgi:putative membrane protein
MVTSLLTDADARAIEAAVARIEGESSAEIVVAVVPRSADYWQGRVLLAVAWAVAAGLVFLLVQPWRDPALSVLVEVLVGALAFAISGFQPVLRLLVSSKAAALAAQARAFQLFAERGLHGTRGRTAVLVFVSELEHRVVLLGDHSIDSALGRAGWQGYVDALVARIRAGQARDGILELLAQLEPQLIAVAPRSADDVNELPDAPLRL